VEDTVLDCVLRLLLEADAEPVVVLDTVGEEEAELLLL
jgi:hypothetical protein